MKYINLTLTMTLFLCQMVIASQSEAKHSLEVSSLYCKKVFQNGSVVPIKICLHNDTKKLVSEQNLDISKLDRDMLFELSKATTVEEQSEIIKTYFKL